MYDLYECKPLLQMPSNVLIKTCISREDSSGMTLIMYCNNYHILYCHLKKRDTDWDVFKDKNNVIIRQIPIDKSKGELRSMSLNENKSKLITIDSKSHIFVIPIQRLISRQKDCILREDAILIDSCSLTNATAIIWWTPLDQLSQIAIVGNDFGEISFIDIKTKREIGKTFVKNSIKGLNIIDDRSSVSLIICCKNETEFRLVLEETRCKSMSKADANCDTNSGSNRDQHLVTNYYFNCFMTTPEEREPIGPNNCWTFKPTLIAMFNDNTVQEFNELISTTIIYQKPSILCLSEAMSESERFGQMIVRIVSNKEFEYNSTEFNAKYLIPKQSVLPINSIISMDFQFIVWSADNCAVVSKDFSDSRKLVKLNPIIQKFSFDFNHIIKCFEFSKTFKTTEKAFDLLPSFIIVTTDCLYVCHQKQSCHQLFHSIITSNESRSLTLMKARRFASMLDFDVQELYEKSGDICLKSRQFAASLRFYQLANTPQLKRIANLLSFGYFSEAIAYIDVMFSSKPFEVEVTDKMHFANIAVKCLVQQLLHKSIKDEEKDLKNSLRLFLRDCLYYDESVVLSLLVEHRVFDLALYCAQLRAQNGLLLKFLLNSSHLSTNVFNETTIEAIIRSDFKDLLLNRNECSDYLNCLTSPQITYSLILHKELIAKYLGFVVKLLPELQMNYLTKLALIFDPRRSETQLLLNRVLIQLKQNYLNSEDIVHQIIYKKDVINFFIFATLMIIRRNGCVNDFNEKFISIDPFIKQIENTNKKQLLVETIGLNAGFSHSAFIRKGCLYFLGKSQFGCCGPQRDNYTNIPQIISNPKRLDLFKEVLSISVKSISLGAQHSLVLTDFGIYAFGSNRFGQLGLGEDVIVSRNPIIINELMNKEIVRTECGQYHSLAISDSGVLWTWGWNLHGQLGLGVFNDVSTPHIVQHLRHKKIIQAFGGFGHTIALDSEGVVYSFGNGKYGQLGIGVNAKHNFPQKISLFNEPIVQICTKYFHSLALSESNNGLYIWGTNPQLIRIKANNIKKLRLNELSNRMSPNIVPNEDFSRPIKVDISNITTPITKICAGSFHSLLLTTCGNVYSFGRGSDGQLGHGKVKDVKIPTKIEAMNEINVVDITAGSNFSLALDINGSLWGFGNNSESQIGSKKLVFNDNNSSTEAKSKKFSNNRKLFDLVYNKSTELLPIRINTCEEVDSYCDSLNYSLDINAMKTSTRFSIIDDNINVLNDEKSVSFDLQIIANLLAFYRHELDMNSVLNRLKSFKCYQMSAFVCETQNDFSNAMDFQLQALELSIPKDNTLFNVFVEKIFCTFIDKSIENIEKMTQILDILLRFWSRNELAFHSLELLLDNCYKNRFLDTMFGISFFNCLKQNQKLSNNFQMTFLLEMVDFTIKSIAKRPEKLFSYQTVIETITSDVENISFPAEKLWQNILTFFHSNNNLNNGLEFKAIDEEIIVFNCGHYYGVNDFKQRVVPNFEDDVKQLQTFQTNDLKNVFDFYRDWDKEVWNGVCPQCMLSQIKPNNYEVLK